MSHWMLRCVITMGCATLFSACAAGTEDDIGNTTPKATNPSSPSGGSDTGSSDDTDPGTTETGDPTDPGPGPGPSSETPAYAPKDAPLFRTADELCKYINEERDGYASHDRFRGPPWSGSYHTSSTWPLHLTVDATLSTEAKTQAAKLAAGGKPEGNPYSDGAPPPHQYLYVQGVDTARYMIQSGERPGDWTTDLAGNLHAGITTNNGTARMALFYHDSGGMGPALSKMGCGLAVAPGGTSWWWVVIMTP